MLLCFHTARASVRVCFGTGSRIRQDYRLPRPPLPFSRTPSRPKFRKISAANNTPNRRIVNSEKQLFLEGRYYDHVERIMDRYEQK